MTSFLVFSLQFWFPHLSWPGQLKLSLCSSYFWQCCFKYSSIFIPVSWTELELLFAIMPVWQLCVQLGNPYSIWESLFNFLNTLLFRSSTLVTLASLKTWWTATFNSFSRLFAEYSIAVLHAEVWLPWLVALIADN